jgi:hypothetical protein
VPDRLQWSDARRHHRPPDVGSECATAPITLQTMDDASHVLDTAASRLAPYGVAIRCPPTCCGILPPRRGPDPSGRPDSRHGRQRHGRPAPVQCGPQWQGKPRRWRASCTNSWM